MQNKGNIPGTYMLRMPISIEGMYIQSYSYKTCKTAT